MTVKTLIKELKKFKPNMKVIVSDGYGYHFYDGDFTVEEFEGSVDIGVGGQEIKEEIKDENS